jgi:hypothetical protein
VLVHNGAGVGGGRARRCESDAPVVRRQFGRRQLMAGRRLLAMLPDAFPYSSGLNLRRTLFFDQTSWLSDDLLERGNRMMAGSIEGRMPFMDTMPLPDDRNTKNNLVVDESRDVPPHDQADNMRKIHRLACRPKD